MSYHTENVSGQDGSDEGHRKDQHRRTRLPFGHHLLWQPLESEASSGSVRLRISKAEEYPSFKASSIICLEVLGLLPMLALLGPHTLHESQAEPEAASRASSCSVWACSSRATSRAIRLMARLVLFCHFQIFDVACGSARVVCGGKIPQAEPVVTVIRKFHPRKFHPRKFHLAKIPPSENLTQRKFHPAKIRLG